MRIIKYAVFNKETNKRVYADCLYFKCEEFIKAQENKNVLEIRYKWFSF